MTADGDRVKSERERRLAEALRENLKKRKLQARGRRCGDVDDRTGVVTSAPAGPEQTKRQPE